jgi:hypothetical protein
MKTIRTNQLTPGNTYLVGGRIAFARLARQTTDEERARDNERRKQASPKAIPVERNYTTATIYAAEVYCNDPNNPTLEERYASECMYISKSKKNYTGSCFTGMNKGDYLPRVYLKDPTTGQFNEITLEKELANDLHVTLVMKVFPGVNGNNGVSLESVLVDDPEGIKYYEPNSDITNNLAARGIVLNSNGNGARKASQGIPVSASDTPNNDTPIPEDIDSVAAPQSTFTSTPQPTPQYSTGNAFSNVPQNNPYTQKSTPGTTNFGPGGRQY